MSLTPPSAATFGGGTHLSPLVTPATVPWFRHTLDTSLNAWIPCVNVG